MQDYDEVLSAGWEERYLDFLARNEVREAIASEDGDAFFKDYPRVINEWAPFIGSPPRARASRIALVSSAGLYLPGQEPFHWQGLFGDSSCRRLPLAPLDSFEIAQGHYDEGPARIDQNVLWPAERLHELVRAGEIGSLAPTGYSIDGYCTDALALLRGAGEEIYESMRAEGVQIALLVPV